ncbi:MAG: MerR family transcriptional regulator [Patulibacter sp.]|nr:MerR family transcriptional regulator [Patulibacter sp.]
MASPDETHQIGEVAERVGLSLRTVRYYEEQGLVVPQARTEGGFRLYTERQVDRLFLVKKMKPLNFTLDEMRTLFAARDALRDPDAAPDAQAQARETIAAFAADAEKRTAKMRKMLAQSEEFVVELRGETA